MFGVIRIFLDFDQRRFVVKVAAAVDVVVATMDAVVVVIDVVESSAAAADVIPEPGVCRRLRGRKRKRGRRIFVGIGGRDRSRFHVGKRSRTRKLLFLGYIHDFDRKPAGKHALSPRATMEGERVGEKGKSGG